MSTCEQKPAGRHLRDPGFGADDGSAPPELAQVLAGFEQGICDKYAMHEVLLRTRLLLALVEVRGGDASHDHSRHEQHGHEHPGHEHRADADADGDGDGGDDEEGTHMAAVSLVNEAGRRALLAFSSASAVTAWRPDARPLAVSAPEAAKTAIQTGSDTLLIDVAGPVAVPVSEAGLAALADGEPWLPPARDRAVREAVARAVLAVAAGLGVPAPAFKLVAAEESDVLIVLRRAPAAGEVADQALDEFGGELAGALAEDPVVKSRLRGGFDIGVM